MNTHEDPPLQEHEALLMAYVDDELDADARADFELRMLQDPELAAEAAQYQQLLDLSRADAQLEPTDADMRRFWSGFYNRTEWNVGWALFAGGLAAIAGFGLYRLCMCELHWLVKAGVLSSLIGGAILLTSTLRQRLRSRRFDRFSGVMR